jgi:hypothetical protein
VQERRLQDKDALNNLYTDLIKRRDQIAKNAGFTNFGITNSLKWFNIPRRLLPFSRFGETAYSAFGGNVNQYQQRKLSLMF